MKDHIRFLKWIRGGIALFCLLMGIFSIEAAKAGWLLASVGWFILYVETK